MTPPVVPRIAAMLFPLMPLTMKKVITVMPKEIRMVRKTGSYPFKIPGKRILKIAIIVSANVMMERNPFPFPIKRTTATKRSTDIGYNAGAYNRI